MTLGPALERVYGTERPAGARLSALQGDASSRRYYRLSVERPRAGKPGSVIVMRLPEDASRSDEGPGDEPPAELPFLNVHRLLSERGIPVPAVLAVDLPHGILLLEDLGDETLERRLAHRGREAWPELYGEAVDLLADLHQRCTAPSAGSLAHERTFDRDLLRWELDHFREWGLEAVHGALGRPQRTRLDELLDAVADQAARMPRGFVHRDYQSRNLMCRSDGTLVLLDFQDALMGPRMYDLVALSCDSYVTIDPELQRAMAARYAERRGLSVETVEDELWRLAVQRKLKDAGRFVYIDKVRNNSNFLRWYPQSVAYVGRALENLGEADPHGPWRALHALLGSEIPGYPDRVAAPASTG